MKRPRGLLLFACLLSVACQRKEVARSQPRCSEPPLFLPFPAGAHFHVLLGNREGGHVGPDAFAWDFDLPQGSPVVAAAAGVVVEVVDRFDAGGPNLSYAYKANRVVLDHGNARFSVYQHLLKRSAAVHLGDRVARGTLLGRTGMSGFAHAPHLHFEIIDVKNQSQPACFGDVQGGMPKTGDEVTSRNTVGEPKRVAKPSTLPADVFVDNGVMLTEALPARLWHGDSWQVRGRTTRTATQAVAFFVPRQGGPTLRHFAAPVQADGHFLIQMDLRDLAGPLGFAVALADAVGQFKSDFAVPVFLAPREQR